MELQLEGQVAIVTGASRGIGRAIAERLSREGMRVVLTARSAGLLDEVAAACPGQTWVFPADLREPSVPAELVAFAVARAGTLDHLVNNAGATRRGPFLELSEADWQDGFALKFYGAVRCARAAWPHLVRSRGSIVNISGIGGRVGDAQFSIGGSVNAALLNLTKVLADQGVTDGVRVNAINPGSVATDRLAGRIAQQAKADGTGLDEAARTLAAAQRVARFGKPEEIAAAVAFLLSPLSGFCQGSILDIDGGQNRAL